MYPNSTDVQKDRRLGTAHKSPARASTLGRVVRGRPARSTTEKLAAVKCVAYIAIPHLTGRTGPLTQKLVK